VPPLELPAMDDLPPERLAEAASVRLFVDRARAADDRFALASANAAAVATVCRGWTGCRWRSSSQRPGSASFRRRRWPAAWATS
jgi:predicted ATPase